MSTPDLLAAVAALAPLAFLVTWVTETLKDATNKNWNGLATRAAAFVGAFAVVSAFAHTPWAVSIAIAKGTNLSTLNWAALALVAVAIAATSGTLADSALIPVAKQLLPGLGSNSTPAAPAAVVVAPDPVPVAPPTNDALETEIAALRARLDALTGPPA